MSDDTKPSAPSAEALAVAICVKGWGDYALAAALDAFAARAVAAERERCLRIIREELAAARVGSVRGSIASIADAIWRGER